MSISGVHDLRPLLQCKEMNKTLKLKNIKEAETESVLLLKPVNKNIDVIAWVYTYIHTYTYTYTYKCTYTYTHIYTYT